MLLSKILYGHQRPRLAGFRRGSQRLPALRGYLRVRSNAIKHSSAAAGWTYSSEAGQFSRQGRSGIQLRPKHLTLSELVFLSHSSIGGNAGIGISRPQMPSRQHRRTGPNCPSASLRFQGITWSIADSWTVNKARQLGSIRRTHRFHKNFVRLLAWTTRHPVRSQGSRKISLSICAFTFFDEFKA